MSVSELQRLEAESIHVMREVAAELERPVDTGHKFPEVIDADFEFDTASDDAVGRLLEALAGDAHANVSAVLEHIGAGPAAIPEPPLRRQGDDRSARWVERFRAEQEAVPS